MKVWNLWILSFLSMLLEKTVIVAKVSLVMKGVCVVWSYWMNAGLRPHNSPSNVSSEFSAPTKR